MMRVLLNSFLFLLICWPAFSGAQNIYFVNFRDKEKHGFNASEYFDQKALDRRSRNGLSLDDPTDWPVNPDYVEMVSASADSVLLVSRWFNMMIVKAGPEQLGFLRALPFVATVGVMPDYSIHPASVLDYDTMLLEEYEGLLVHQISSMQGNLFSEAGIDGKGVRIAIFDVGFPGAKENPAFETIFKEGRVIATRDFSKRKDEDVFWGKEHGSQVWSCIAGHTGGLKTGLATGAEFLLAKTEVNREPFSEEVHWLAAAEWADKNGADIINSSLGYTQRRYFPWDMDGKTSFIAKAANMAARKGILVVNAAGNEGDNDWVTIGTPADADSVLAIGGIDPETGYHTSFSSFGPTADKRLKPNVSAFGHVVAFGSKNLILATGTSFASPLVAGFAACVLQLRPNTPAMQLFRMIEQSGNLYPYFDYAHGYGIPQAGYFLNTQDSLPEPTFSVLESADSIVIRVADQFINMIDNEVDSDHPVYNQKNRYLYYNVMNYKGVIDSYYVVEVSQPEVLVLNRQDYSEGQTVNIHFAGYTAVVKPGTKN